MLIDNCDAVVYVPFIERIVTAGVYSEVKYALKSGKDVYKITSSGLKKITSLNEIGEETISVEVTRRLYKILEVIDEYVLRNELSELRNRYPHIAIEEALEIISKYRLQKYRTEIKLHGKERWLHWWQEYPGYKIKITGEELFNYTKELMQMDDFWKFTIRAEDMGLVTLCASPYKYGEVLIN